MIGISDPNVMFKGPGPKTKICCNIFFTLLQDPFRQLHSKTFEYRLFKANKQYNLFLKIALCLGFLGSVDSLV